MRHPLLSSRRRRHGEHGQAIVLLALMMVVLLASIAIVVDLGMLRSDKARLQNALDAAALAAGQALPATAVSGPSHYQTVTNTAVSFTQTNYPGVDTPEVEFACLIGVDGSGNPRVTDMPGSCFVSFAANSSQWRCTEVACWAPCTPATVSTDVCNTVIVSNAAIREYGFGKAVGVPSGSTGAVQAAACTGFCGQPPAAPVDAVVILDRTGSMDQSNSVQALRTGAGYVLGAFNPEYQRIAMGFTGPTSLNRTTSVSSYSNNASRPSMTCSPPDVRAIALEPGAAASGPMPSFVNATSNANASGGATSLQLTKPSSTQTGDLLLASIAVNSNANISAPSGWTQVGQVDSSSGSTRIRLAVYRKAVASGETGPYTFTWSGSQRASGGIVAYRGAAASPISDTDTNSGNDTSSPFAAQADAVTADANGVVLAFYGIRSGSTWTAPTTPAGMSERFDVRNNDTNGPATSVATLAMASGGSSGNLTANATGGSGGRWATITVAIEPTTGPADVYGTNVNTDMDQWIPIGFSGMDEDSPAVTFSEAYSDENGVVNTGSSLYRAINCFDVSSTGTNLARPLYMAIEYLADHGRPGVKQGIILETDGAPSNGGYGPSSDYSNAGVLAAATAAKNAGIDLYTIGYGVDNATVALLGQMATGPIVNGSTCNAAENSDGDHFFCQPVGGDLASILRAAAQSLAAGTKLIQLYPRPIVTAVAPASGSIGGGTVITITGKYFDDAYAVSIGGQPVVSFAVESDTQIRARVAPGTVGVKDVIVSTPGGSSAVNGASKFTYTSP